MTEPITNILEGYEEGIITEGSRPTIIIPEEVEGILRPVLRRVGEHTNSIFWGDIAEEATTSVIPAERCNLEGHLAGSCLCLY